jgi:hypothetical protein
MEFPLFPLGKFHQRAERGPARPWGRDTSGHRKWHRAMPGCYELPPSSAVKAQGLLVSFDGVTVKLLPGIKIRQQSPGSRRAIFDPERFGDFSRAPLQRSVAPSADHPSTGKPIRVQAGDGHHPLTQANRFLKLLYGLVVFPLRQVIRAHRLMRLLFVRSQGKRSAENSETRGHTAGPIRTAHLLPGAGPWPGWSGNGLRLRPWQGSPPPTGRATNGL